MKFICALFISAVTAIQAATPQPAKLYVELPENCPTPDALAVAPDGSLTLSCPNYAKGGHPGVLLTISKDRKVSKLADIPPPNGNGKGRPMGIAYGADGALYVNANGRLLCMTFRSGELDRTEVVAAGLKGPNGLRHHKGALYVTTPKLRQSEAGKNVGGVYRFRETERDVVVGNSDADPHLIFTSETQNPEKQFGLDGIAFDKDGNLYVSDFGDAIIFKLTLNRDGNITKQDVYADLQTTGIDGMIFDDQGNLFVTGFSKNRLIKVDADRKVSVVAEYPDNNSADGQLDQPVDLVVFEGQLIISNFDLMSEPTMVNRSHGKPYTLSCIELDQIR